jgi:hypothetical protein
MNFRNSKALLIVHLIFFAKFKLLKQHLAICGVFILVKINTVLISLYCSYYFKQPEVVFFKST